MDSPLSKMPILSDKLVFIGFFPVHPNASGICTHALQINQLELTNAHLKLCLLQLLYD